MHVPLQPCPTQNVNKPSKGPTPKKCGHYSHVVFCDVKNPNVGKKVTKGAMKNAGQLFSCDKTSKSLTHAFDTLKLPQKFAPYELHG